jgi:hypothetical protein
VAKPSTMEIASRTWNALSIVPVWAWGPKASSTMDLKRAGMAMVAVDVVSSASSAAATCPGYLAPSRQIIRRGPSLRPGGGGLLRRGGGRLGGAGRDGSWRGSAMAQPPSPWRAPLEGGLVPSQPVVRRESTGRPPGPSRGVSGRFVLRRGHVDLVALQPEQLTGTIMVNARYGRPGARSAQWPGMMAPYRLYTFRVYTLAVIGLAHSGSMRWAPGVHGNLSQAMSS